LTKEHYQFFLYQLLRALKYIHTGNGIVAVNSALFARKTCTIDL
jgi:hypothetical protein